MTTINPLFAFHRLNPTGIDKAKSIAEEFSRLVTALEALCPTSRELSVVKTKLEEACFFAKKAMANAPENQEQ